MLESGSANQAFKAIETKGLPTRLRGRVTSDTLEEAASRTVGHMSPNVAVFDSGW